MTQRSGFLLVVGVGGIALLTGWRFLPRHVPDAVPTSAGETSPAVPEAENKLVVCYGYADLEDGISYLHPSQPGRVAGIPVKENASVAAGAVLLRLDDRAARYRVAEARAVLDASLALLAKAGKGSEQHRA